MSVARHFSQFGDAWPLAYPLSWGLARSLGLSARSPVIDLRFAGAEELHEDVTFTRSTKAWDYDSTGTLEENASAAARFDYDPSTLKALGLLVEAQRTRLTTHFSPGANATDGITATDLTVTKLTDTDNPYAGLENDVWKVVNSSGASKNVVFGGSVANTNAHSARIQAKVVSGAPTLNVTGTTAPADSQTLNASGSWEKNLLENFTPGNADNQIQVTVPNSAEVHLIGATLEEGAFVTSEILGNGTTTTRNADDASMDLPSELASGFVWVVHARTAPVSGNEYIGRIDNSSVASPDERILLRRSSGNQIEVFVIEGGIILWNQNITSVGDNTDFRIAFAAEDGNYRISIDGGTVVQDTTSGFPTLTNKRIGQRINGTRTWDSTIALDKMYANPGDWSDADLQEASS